MSQLQVGNRSEKKEMSAFIVEVRVILPDNNTLKQCVREKKCTKLSVRLTPSKSPRKLSFHLTTLGETWFVSLALVSWFKIQTQKAIMNLILLQRLPTQITADHFKKTKSTVHFLFCRWTHPFARRSWYSRLAWWTWGALFRNKRTLHFSKTEAFSYVMR